MQSFDQILASIRGMAPRGNAFYAGPSPAELEAIYRRGFKGVHSENATPETIRTTKQFLASQPGLYDVFPWARGIGKGKLSAPYLAMLHFAPTFGGDEAQFVGSCTTHATVNGASLSYASDALWGESVYKGRLIYENLYRARGSNQDGWYNQGACTYISPAGKGGLLLRKDYTSPTGQVIDLDPYSVDTENWANNGRAGVPEWLEEISRSNKAQWIFNIPDMDTYRDTLALGIGIACSGNLGWSNTTDKFGVAQLQGSWSHAMAHAAVDDRPWAHTNYGDLIGLILQSWGKWNRQNGRPEGAPVMPVGSFWSRANAVSTLIRGGDCFGVAGVQGYDRTESFMSYLRSSTGQDAYKHRQEAAHEAVEEHAANGFLAI